MKYQIIEKPIYSEGMLLHFGDKHEMGEIVNEHFPDYSGVPIGDAIYESEALEEVNDKKAQLEFKRLKTLNGAINSFFENDDLAEQFYSSDNFSALKRLYREEFNLELIRRTHNEMVVVNDEFYFPDGANEEQMKRIQELLGLYFFEIINVGAINKKG